MPYVPDLVLRVDAVDLSRPAVVRSAVRRARVTLCAPASPTSGRGRCPTATRSDTHLHPRRQPGQPAGRCCEPACRSRTCSTRSTGSASTTTPPTSTASPSPRWCRCATSPPARRARCSSRSPSTSEEVRDEAPARCCSSLAGCNGTTGSGLVTFTALAGGPADAAGAARVHHRHRLPGDAHARAAAHRRHLPEHVGPSSGAGATLLRPARHLRRPRRSGRSTVDLLSPTLQPFSARARGPRRSRPTAEVWLTGGDINAADDPTLILDVAARPRAAGPAYPFQRRGHHRQQPRHSGDQPALPGANPICKQRIATPIVVDLTPTDGGVLDAAHRSARNVPDGRLRRAAPAAESSPTPTRRPGAALFKGLFVQRRRLPVHLVTGRGAP